MSASLIGRLGSSAFRLSTTAVLMSLTGSCFSSESALGPLYGAFLVKKFLCRAAHHFPSSDSLFDLKVRSFIPMVKPHRVELGPLGRSLLMMLLLRPRGAGELRGHRQQAALKDHRLGGAV